MKARALGFLLGLVAGVALAFVLAFHEPKPRAQSYIADTAASPLISLTPDQLRKFWSNQALANGVTTDAQWNTAMATIFSSANWPGVNATSLAFLRSFFIQVVHVGYP